MKNYSTKHTLFILIGVIVLLAVAHYVVFHFIRSESTEVLTLEQEVASLQTQVQEFSKYEPEDLKLLAASVNAKIIPHGDFVNFLETIETSGRAQGISVNVQSVNVVPRSEENPDDDKQIMHVRLDTHGSWAPTMRFVNYLEHLPYKIAVTDLRLTKDGPENEGGTNGWRGAIEVTALKFK